MKDINLLDKKTKKSLLNLRYLSYIFLVLVIGLGFVGSVIYGLKLSKEYEEFSSSIYIWIGIVYVTAFMVVWGILDVIKLLNNLYQGNIFTHTNAKILRIIDKKIIFTIVFAIVANAAMVLANATPAWFLLVWLVFIIFLIVGHILVNPLALIVSKSADMHLEMELTI